MSLQCAAAYGIRRKQRNPVFPENYDNPMKIIATHFITLASVIEQSGRVSVQAITVKRLVKAIRKAG